MAEAPSGAPQTETRQYGLRFLKGQAAPAGKLRHRLRSAGFSCFDHDLPWSDELGPLDG